VGRSPDPRVLADASASLLLFSATMPCFTCREAAGHSSPSAMQSAASTWLRKTCDEKVFEGHVSRRRGDERSSGDHVIENGGDDKVC
jgi:hypothetical protein